jgi:hemerythrin
VGVRQFDEEHSMIVAMVNRLHDAIKAGESAEKLDAIMLDLAGFANSHFAHEEALLAKYEYPELDQHHNAHQELLNHLELHRKSVILGTTVSQFEMLQFLMDWLMEHTRDVDKKHGEFLNNLGVA